MSLTAQRRLIAQNCGGVNAQAPQVSVAGHPGGDLVSVAETKITIKLAVEAQRRLDDSASATVDDGFAVCRGMAAMRAEAIAEAGTDAPNSRKYQAALKRRLRLYGFERHTKTARSIMIAVAENLPAITTWLATLPAAERSQYIQPRTVYERWQHSLGAGSKRETVKPNPVAAVWRRSSHAQRNDGLAEIPFDDFRVHMPPEWHAGMRAAAHRLIDELRDPDARLTRAIQDALTSVTVADAPGTSVPVREAHKLAALTSLRQALLAMRSVKRTIREVDVGLAVSADIVCARKAA